VRYRPPRASGAGHPVRARRRRRPRRRSTLPFPSPSVISAAFPSRAHPLAACRRPPSSRAATGDTAPAPSPAGVWQLAWHVVGRWATDHRIAGRLACLFLGSASYSSLPFLPSFLPSFLLLTMKNSAQVQISARVALRSGCSPECLPGAALPFQQQHRLAGTSSNRYTLSSLHRN
jgi:hypothetical protein